MAAKTTDPPVQGEELMASLHQSGRRETPEQPGPLVRACISERAERFHSSIAFTSQSDRAGYAEVEWCDVAPVAKMAAFHSSQGNGASVSTKEIRAVARHTSSHALPHPNDAAP